ncbi:hypothetical protein [Streptomyces sp. SID9124]|uniref:hypothetical protein n=1 Tax=Streptomyces sp. SID9124 TaxID=2706108 RepID=UPI0013E07307|nr:hypothetical protein [Streptomyces sp. SID9124]NED13789.1 hypothetical protein [Streptomyces sp. SID9124]
MIEAVTLRGRDRLYSGPVVAIAAGLVCLGVLGLLSLPFGRGRPATGDDRASADARETQRRHRDFLKTLREYRPSSETLLRSGTAAHGSPARVEIGGTAGTGTRLAFLCRGAGHVELIQRPVDGAGKSSAVELGASALRCEGALVDIEPAGPAVIILRPTDSGATLSWAVTL